jgi:hypothetical protein
MDKSKNTINTGGSGNYIIQDINSATLSINTHENSNINLENIANSQIIINYYPILNEVEEKLRKVKKLSNAINSYLLIKQKDEYKTKLKDGKASLSDLFLTEEQVFRDKCNKYLTRISELREKKDKPTDNEINNLIAETNSMIDEVGYFFSHIVYSSIGTNKFVDSVIKQIGHKDLQSEGKLHLERINEIEKQIDYDELFKSDFVFLSDKGTQTIIFCKVIEENRQSVIKIFETDKSRQRKTKNYVTRTLFFIILLFAVAFGLIYNKIIPDLTDYKLPLLNIPLSIIIWGFIGSFASMNYRFNKKPISDFGDTIKWLITRPTQGIILSSAFYLALVSGLFLLTSNASETNRNEIFLFLAFLIGFSDKFVDNVFKILVNKFIDANEPSKKDDTKKDDNNTTD